MADPELVPPECAACAAVQRKKGTTYCWSAEGAGVPRPGACPTLHHAGIVDATIPGYVDGGDDARLALVAARVEGLCYEKVGDGAVHARWTRVEDTIAFASRR